MRKKLRAARQIGIDLDPRVIRAWRQGNQSELCELVEIDCVNWLRESNLEPSALIYADPPYLPSTRRRARVYRYDYQESHHVQLLEMLRTQPCRVMISGYRSSLYSILLRGWEERSFQVATHVGLREETVWFNFTLPEVLHDTRHLGNGFREREAIRRRRRRLESRIMRLSSQERHSLYGWLGHQIKDASP